MPDLPPTEEEALLSAVTAGRADDVAHLLTQGANPGTLVRGVAPLHVAAAGGNELLGAFVASADVDLASLVSRSELPFVEIARRLLDSGAAVNVRTEPAGFTPLMIARYFGRHDIVELLRARGADPDLRDALGRTAERFAVFPIMARLIRLCRRLEMVETAYVAQVHAPATHQFTSPVVGLELTAPLPPDAFAAWPADEPLVAFGLGEDAVSRLVRLTPPVYARTREAGPDGRHARTFTLHFDDPRPPYKLAYAVEKLTEMLLPVDASSTPLLIFRGHRSYAGIDFDVTLVFEAVDATRTYSLHATASSKTSGFAVVVAEREAVWRRALPARDAPIPHVRGERYAADVREAIEQVVKAAASRREDAGKIRALQRDVLARFEKGNTLNYSDKDGGSELRWRNGTGVFEEHDHRDCLNRQEFTDPDAFLAFVRSFCSWEIKRESAPHPPLEMDAWWHILRRLR